jgi:hypothetical protein
MLALGLLGWLGIGVVVMIVVILVISIAGYPSDNSF